MGAKTKRSMDVWAVKNQTLRLDDLTPGDILTWSQVSEIHRIRNGIYHQSGHLISLLTDFGRINPCYPDFHGDSTDIIHYTGNGRRGDQKLDLANRALLNAIETKHSVPLFNKLSPGRWGFMGFWQVRDGNYIFDENQSRMLWKFQLQKSLERSFFQD